MSQLRKPLHLAQNAFITSGASKALPSPTDIMMTFENENRTA
jgi:hypothetical protein